MRVLKMLQFRPLPISPKYLGYSEIKVEPSNYKKSCLPHPKKKKSLNAWAT